MPEINNDTQYEAAEAILHQLCVLAELLQEHPSAYKLCYELSQNFIKYLKHARMLTENNKQLNLNLGGF